MGSNDSSAGSQNPETLKFSQINISLSCQIARAVSLGSCPEMRTWGDMFLQWKRLMENYADAMIQSEYVKLLEVGVSVTAMNCRPIILKHV